MLARFGLNCVRFHFLDGPNHNERPNEIPFIGLIDWSRDNSRRLDPKQLDRLDVFVAELKKRGIYTDLNLNVGRYYKEGDSVRDPELLGFAKGVVYYDQRLQELLREFAGQLLTHYNPYTRSEYRHEPAVLMVEILNENSVVEEWVRGRLKGLNTRKYPGTWTDISSSYEKQLTAHYNSWLARNIAPGRVQKLRSLAGVGDGSPVPRLQPSEFTNAQAERFHTEARFYMELEETFFRSMRDYLKQDLGLKSLVVGTSVHNGNVSAYPLLRSTSQLDIVDNHAYWTPGRDGAGPMVADPLHSTIVRMSRSAVAGKPYLVSEYNHPTRGGMVADGIPVLAAYAALQDWDGIIWYTLEHKDPADWRPKLSANPNDLWPDPMKMTQLAAGALMFLRGDVRPAAETFERSYSFEQVVESLRLPQTEKPYFTPGFPLSLPLRHGTRIRSLDAAQDRGFPAETGVPIQSDTRELTWYSSASKTGLVAVDTPRTQALVGFLGAHPVELANLSARVRNPICALILSSLDGAPVASSSRLLLSAASRVENTGMKFDETSANVLDWGTAPTRIEPVTGSVVLRKLAAVESVEVIPLDTTGVALGRGCPAQKVVGGWEIKIGEPVTTWYVIRVQRRDWNK